MNRKSFEVELADLWSKEFVLKHCILCGNKGIVDTRGIVHTPNGIETGGIAFCICPNGRSLKRNGAKLIAHR